MICERRKRSSQYRVEKPNVGKGCSEAPTRFVLISDLEKNVKQRKTLCVDAALVEAFKISATSIATFSDILPHALNFLRTVHIHSIAFVISNIGTYPCVDNSNTDKKALTAIELSIFANDTVRICAHSQRHRFHDDREYDKEGHLPL